MKISRHHDSTSRASQHLSTTPDGHLREEKLSDLWLEPAMKGAMHAFSFLVVLFLFQNQALGANTRQSLRQAILAGHSLSMNASSPEKDRTIDANWIKEAVTGKVRIQVHHAVIQGPLELQDSIIEQEFNLSDCTFRDRADFSHAVFKRDFFVSDAVFLAGASFQNAAFERKATFQRTRFNGDPIIFADAHFFGEFSANDAMFGSEGGGTVVFSHARFDSLADFSMSVFNINAHFITTQFGGQGYFPGTRFNGSADFSRAHFFDVATFGAGIPVNFNTEFERQAIFIETQFDSFALFSGVAFDDETVFVGARFGGDVHFETSNFRRPVSFRSTIFHAVYFSKKEAGGTSPFGNDIDLLGCTYDRIEVDWLSLIRYPDGRSRIHPYNRQPFTHLEDVLRKSGFEQDADKVYAERRRVENGKGSGKIWDDSYWLVANYGIDLWHEFIFAIGFLLLGTWVFSRPKSVIPNDEKSKDSISWLNALFLAVHQFLPLSLPVKARWTPSHHILCKWKTRSLLTAATYANLLQIVGWILIPLAAAWLAGFLHHAAQ
jgi:hypothetical protein